MEATSLARRKGLPSPRWLSPVRLSLFGFMSFSPFAVESSSHGTVRKALWSPVALCLPLLRPNRHQRLLERLVSAGASGSFLSRAPRCPRPEQGSLQPAHHRLPELGGSLCPQPQDPPGVGPKRGPQRGSRPALVAPDAQAGRPWSLFHFQEHGTRADLPHQRAEVPDQRPQLPNPVASAQPLHPLLLLHLR